MGIRLGANDYGKAENRVVRIYRDTPRHEIRDVTVSTALRGDFTAAHLAGDQSRVLPTDTQKNTVYAYAKEHGLHEIEDYALTPARHFVSDVDPVEGARVEVDEHTWERLNDYSWVRRESEIRTTVVEVSWSGRRWSPV
jgi:urate oxidase